MKLTVLVPGTYPALRQAVNNLELEIQVRPTMESHLLKLTYIKPTVAEIKQF